MWWREQEEKEGCIGKNEKPIIVEMCPLPHFPQAEKYCTEDTKLQPRKTCPLTPVRHIVPLYARTDSYRKQQNQV